MYDRYVLTDTGWDGGPLSFVYKDRQKTTPKTMNVTKQILS